MFRRGAIETTRCVKLRIRRARLYLVAVMAGLEAPVDTMRKRRPLFWAGIAVLLGLSLGCSLFAEASPTISVPSATPLQTEAPAATLTPVTTKATETPAASPAASECPESRAISPPERPIDDPSGLANFIEDLQGYLAQGGDPGLIPLMDFETMLRGDLTGNGNEETVFALIDPQSDQLFPEAHLLIFTCQSGDVKVLYHYASLQGYGLELIALQDLTQDGVDDLIFSEYSCGAHTCWHTPNVWTWQGSDFVNQMGSDFQFPYPVYTVGATSLVVVSGGVGSVGAGPQRPVTTTLAWTGQVITVTGEVLGPPTYRYHAFLDGDRALSTGDYASAATDYERVIVDDTLEPWGAFFSAGDERQWFGVLGQWRQVILAAIQGQSAEAQAAYDGLDLALAPGDPGYPVIELAQRFWRSYQRDGDVVAACAYAVDSDQAQPALDFLNSFGYSNPVYEVPDLCPSYGFQP